MDRFDCRASLGAPGRLTEPEFINRGFRMGVTEGRKGGRSVSIMLSESFETPLGATGNSLKNNYCDSCNWDDIG